ncbi:DegT/DnrJ/EryC1/StrS family aminotransferase [Patescibacteria group bacterium]|nr:DegT/DnrJ/EryC1/StrS family aminotransferase [Patescibacteria group bacterium]
MKKLIPVFYPDYGEEEVRAVSRVLRSGWIGLGPVTEEFEKRFAAYIGAPYAIAVNSATAALHLSVLAAGIGPGDEVIVPSLTFASTAHAVLYAGGTPVFADIDAETLDLSVDALRKKITKKTRAVIPVHYGGYPCDMEAISALADSAGLTVIEDASHACGTVYQGKKIGSISPFTCFSFHAVKNLATGDGGMITVRDKKLAEILRRLRWVGISKNTWERLEDIRGHNRASYKAYGWYYEVTDLGYKYHMNDITAALGIVQLSKLEKGNEKRRRLAARYTEAFKNIPEIRCPKESPGIVSAKHNYVIRTRERDRLHLYLREKNISTGVHYMPVHLQPYYRKRYPKTGLPVTEAVWPELLTLPLFPGLTTREQEYIIRCVRQFYRAVPADTRQAQNRASRTP